MQPKRAHTASAVDPKCDRPPLALRFDKYVQWLPIDDFKVEGRWQNGGQPGQILDLGGNFET
jgi:hypothetical protein